MKSDTTKPFFTIIIPCLNEEKHLPQLLRNLSSQTFTDFTVVVVDAHSEDNTVAKANTFAKQISLTIINSTKRHVSYQRNLGAKQSNSPWLIFMDADDQIPPYFLQGIKYRVEEKNPEILTTYTLPDSQNPQDLLICHLINLYIEMQKNTSNASVLESMMVFKRNVFNSLEGFSDQVQWGEGGDLMRRAHKKGVHLTICKSPTYTYSTRRLRKDGTLKLARNLAFQEMSRILQIPIEEKTAKKMYPMKGGKYFEQTEHVRSPVIQLLSHLSSPKKFRQELYDLMNKQITLSHSLEPLIRFFNNQEKPKAARTHSAKANKK